MSNGLSLIEIHVEITAYFRHEKFGVVNILPQSNPSNADNNWGVLDAIWVRFVYTPTKNLKLAKSGFLVTG